MSYSHNWLQSITIMIVVCGLLGCGQQPILPPSSGATNVNERIETKDATEAAALATIEAALSVTPTPMVTPIFTTTLTEPSIIITVTITPNQLATATPFPTSTVAATRPPSAVGHGLVTNILWFLLLLLFLIVAYMGRNSSVLLAISFFASISIILITPIREVLASGVKIGFYALHPWLLAYRAWTLPLILVLIIIFSQRAMIGAVSIRVLYLFVHYFITILVVLLPISVCYALRQTVAAQSWLTSYWLWISLSVILGFIFLYREFGLAAPESQKRSVTRRLQQILVTPLSRTTQAINARITAVKKIYTKPIPHIVVDESLPVVPKMEVELLKGYILDQPGGKFLLTGYGRFGGTSLVNEAMRRVRKEYMQGPLLIINFSVTKQGITLPRNPIMQTFKITANQINLGVLSTRRLNDSALAEALRQHAESFEQLSQTPSGPLIYHIPVKRNFVERILTFLLGLGPATESFNLERFITDLNRALDSGVTTPFLRRWITQFTASSNLPARIVFVFDKLEQFEVLKTLVNTQLCENERIAIIALARREALDDWEVSTHQITDLGFQLLPVRCIWGGRSGNNGIDYVQEVVKRQLPNIEIPSTYVRDFHILCKYLCYVGYGIPGEIHAHFDKNPWLFTAVKNQIPVSDLSSGELIESKAWMQEVLELNWHIIAAGWLNRDSEEDRARIGTYHLLEWIDDRKQFYLKELLEAASQTSITISKHEYVINEVVRSLLWVLKEHNYLNFIDGKYRPPGPKNKLLKPRQVRYPDLQSPDIIAPTITWFEDENHQKQLKITIRQQSELPRRQANNNKLKILFVYANPQKDKRLDFEKEEEAIKKCTENEQSQVKLEMKSLPFASTTDFAAALLRDNFQIIHFSGHTNKEGYLLFEAKNGQDGLMHLKGFARNIVAHGATECVILNACDSLDQGTEIPPKIPIVIAMDGPISDKAAIRFATGFYEAIATGRSYDKAYESGCNFIATEFNLQSDVEIPRIIDPSDRNSDDEFK